MISQTLNCDHCGGPAITSDDGYFFDGQGDKCNTCGISGQVCINSDRYEEDEVDVYWEDSGEKCEDMSCKECHP